MARRVVVVVTAIFGAVLVAIGGAGLGLAHEPVTGPGHLLGKTAPAVDVVTTASLPSGFQDQVIFSGLVHPSVVSFSPDGRIFVAEKSGLIKVFDSLTDTSPTVFADLRSNVDDYWDRGLLGLALPPDFPTNPWVYVLYTYDAPIGGTAPVWSDACPTPPGPTTDGCVVSGRLSRLQAAGNVMTGSEQVLINDWCQQHPSHSIGSLVFGPDGALYASGGDGASFNVADYGQTGGSTGSPTPANPCGDPPAGVGGTETPPTAEGGALRSQDVRTKRWATYAATVMADAPTAYWRLGESSGSTAADQLGTSPGAYGAGATLGASGALAGDGDPSVNLAGTVGQRPVVIAHTAALDLGNGPFTIEAWARRSNNGTSDAIVDYGYGSGGGGPALEFVGDKIGLWQNGVGLITQETGTTTDTAWHHLVATWNGTTGKLYKDGILVSGASTGRVLTAQVGAVLIGANQDAGEEFGGGLDEVAIYRSVLSAGQVSNHYNAGMIAGAGSDPAGLDGAILRLDPTTGAAMLGNPNAASPESNAQRIVAYGFRNPFRFTFRPGTSELWAGDVGWSTWEELDLIANPTAALVDYGWPCYEGAGRQPTYDGLNLDLCENLYAAGSGAVAAPYFTYNHAATVVSGETCPTTTGSSVSGLAFYQGGAYPSSYNGGLFFADYSRDCIWFMPAGVNGRPNVAQVATFVAGAANPVNLAMGPGGDLFYVDYDGGTIHRVTYFAGNQPPTAAPVATPTSGSAPLTVAFDGTASTDPEGGTLAYAWDFNGDGTDDATTATASYSYQSSGTYLARLRVTDPGGLSDSKTVAITVDNTPPVPTIASPSSTLTWAVGDTIGFSGSASDAEDGSLAAAQLSWTIILHHCPTDPNSCHTHTIQTFSAIASGSFTAPDHAYPSWLEIVLTATDSGGLRASTSVRLDPKTVVLSFATSPAGLQLAVGGASAATPFTLTVILGSNNTIGALSPQDAGRTRYAWVSWSDGGAQTHDIVATGSASFGATFQPVSADVGITQGSVVSPGRVTLALDVGNAGPVTATGLVVTDALPNKLSFVSATSTAGSCAYQSSNRTVICTLGSLATGAHLTVTIVTNAQKGTVTNVASVTASSPDVNMANNSTTTSIRLR
jgi:uncharacterized repeat protein (TIGR01451 family)